MAPFVAIGIADRQVIAPHHDAPGIIFVVDNRIGTAGDDTGGNAGAVTKMAGRQHIGRSQQVGKPVNHSLVFAACSVTQHN